MTTIRTIRAGSLRARFSAHRRKRIRGVALPLVNYWQEDYHSCGFLAALTVAEYLRPGTDPRDVLSAVRPALDSGTPRRRMVAGLAALGITAKYRDDLSVFDLHLLVRAGVPTIVSVWPEWWVGDHWTVVQGFSAHRVYLTNHYSMTVDWFNSEWIDSWGDGSTTGAGLVCVRKD